MPKSKQVDLLKVAAEQADGAAPSIEVEATPSSTALFPEPFAAMGNGTIVKDSLKIDPKG